MGLKLSIVQPLQERDIVREMRLCEREQILDRHQNFPSTPDKTSLNIACSLLH